MPGFLRQSTASQSRSIGPFVDSTDYQTAETGLTIANTDIKLVVNGGASANKNSGGGTHRVNGVYGITFDATDTATVGEIELSVVVAGALPVFDKFFVLEETVYDALFAASALGYVANAPVNVAQFGGSNGTFASGRPEVNTTHIAGSAVSTSTAQIGVNVVNAGGTAWASGSLTSGVFASGAITATAIAADAIGASELAADAIAEIADAVWDEDATGHQTQGTFGQAIGDPVADTNTIYKAVVTDATGATVGVDVVAIQADTDNIQTRLPAALVSGRMDASVGAMAADVLTAAATAADFGTEIGTAVWATATRTLTAGTNINGSTFTAIPWNSAWDAEVQSEVDDALVAQRLDELLNADSDIDGAAPPTVGSVFHELMTKTAGSFTYDQTTDSLEALRDRGDAAWITSTLTASAIADQVWDEALAGHLSAGSTGEALNAAGAAGDPWTTSLPGAYGAGSAGYIIGTNLDAAVTTRMATYTQPTGFLAATFPGGTIANTTNITAGTITTATNVTTVNGLAANVITAAATAADFTTEIQAGLATQASVDVIDGIVDSILVDTAEIGVAGAGLTNINLPNQTMDIVGNITGNLSGSVGSVTGLTAANLDATISSRATPAQVNTEVVDALATDTYTEPTGAPGVTVSLKDKIGYIYMALRNKLTVTSTAKTFYDDGGAAEWSKALSDDSTTYTEDEGA